MRPRILTVRGVGPTTKLIPTDPVKSLRTWFVVVEVKKLAPAESTVSVTELVMATPCGLVTTHRNCVPLSAITVTGGVKEVDVAAGIFAKLPAPGGLDGH